jgi:hypothetical protein
MHEKILYKKKTAGFPPFPFAMAAHPHAHPSLSPLHRNEPPTPWQSRFAGHSNKHVSIAALVLISGSPDELVALSSFLR